MKSSTYVIKGDNGCGDISCDLWPNLVKLSTLVYSYSWKFQICNHFSCETTCSGDISFHCVVSRGGGKYISQEKGNIAAKLGTVICNNGNAGDNFQIKSWLVILKINKK